MSTNADNIQISANVSAETNARIERFVSEHGVKRSHLIERALEHYLSALEAIPTDVIIPPTLVVTSGSGAQIAGRLESPPPPTDAMKALFDESR
jgi:hypothetical protein